MKKQRPKLTQYIYLVNSLLTAKINKNGCVTDDDIKEAVDTTIKVYDMIEDAIGTENVDDDEQDSDKVPVDEFARFPWNGSLHTYTELEKWYLQYVKRSKRAFGKSYHDALQKGFLLQDIKTRKYKHGNGQPVQF